MPDFSKRLKRYSKVQINNVNMGGIADSQYLGGKNSVDDMLGLDIHSEAGIIKVNQALTKESGSTIDGKVPVMVACTDGNTYLFSSDSGKIWSRTYTGIYTLEATAADTIYGAFEYQGYIYYAMPTYLGRWQLGTAWSTRNDTWFALTLAFYRPMLVQNAVLYIGNKNKVAQVDAGVATANALTLETNYLVTALGQLGTDLLAGTQNKTGYAQIFRWNTWSVSFTNSDPIAENIINAFIPLSNAVLLNAGYEGNIYLYNGSSVDLYKKVRLSATIGSDQSFVSYNAVLNFYGKTFFGIGLLYSLARTNKGYPYVINKEVGVSSGISSNVKIYSIVKPEISAGLNIYLVAWRDGTVGNYTYGVDKLDLTLKYTGAYIATRLITVDRFDLNTYGDFKVAWRTKPASTGFTFYTKKNNGSYVAVDSGDQKSDTDRNVDGAVADIGDATSIQAKVAITVSGNNAPEIEAIEIGLNTVD